MERLWSRWSREATAAAALGVCLISVAVRAAEGEGVRLGRGIPFLSTGHDARLDLRDEVTLEAWVKPGKLPSGGSRIIDMSVPGTSQGFVLDTFPGNSLRMICEERLLQCKAKLPSGKWSHVAAVFSRPKGVYRLYVNGKPVADAGRPGMKALSACKSPLRIGADCRGGNRFVGYVRRAAVYARALSDEQIASLAKSPAGETGLPDAVGLWVFAPSAAYTYRNTAGDAMTLTPPADWIQPLNPARVNSHAGPPAADWALWYRQPAGKWEEALPVGNGRLGAMIFGGAPREQLQCNEDTVWTGAPHDYAHPGAVASLPEIRRLLGEGKQREAEQLAMRTFMSEPLRQKAYQPCVDLWLDFPGHDTVEDYRRTLDLETAVHRVEYRIGGVHYVRETFASYPDQVLVTRISADRPGSIDCDVRMSTPHADATTEVTAPDRLALHGKVEEGGVAFSALVKLRADGASVAAAGARLTVRGANSVTVLWTAATNVASWKKLAGDPGRHCLAALDAVASVPFDLLRQRHLDDYQPLYRRVSLDLGPSQAHHKPTDQRIADFGKGDDAQLAALTFQYGRYLLLSCSRSGAQPANLQGLWNPHLRPPWDSKYTCNINTEMNYWPAEVAALGECDDALFTALEELMESGKRTAKVHYGARGWVLHHNFDMWRGTAPINASNHGIWVTGGAWLSTHLWEHYLFTSDLAFLRERAYPIMKQAALFFVDFLVEDPKTGWLISSPSNSPEQGGLVAGPTMDHQIIRSLFRACIEASDRLGEDQAFAATLAAMVPRIAPNQIGKHGQLQEWLEDRDNPSNQHRHVSHLWGVYPGADIDWLHAPKLWAAARQSLIFRGDGATGWSMGWKVNLWARFLDGNHAYKILGNLLAPVGSKGRGGMYPNLFDAHPPFQIDGNFGACAGIAEMLLQSHVRVDGNTGEDAFLVHLLPALPDAWPHGALRGLRARGGRKVDLQWQDGRLVSATVASAKGGRCHLRYGDGTLDVVIPAGGSVTVDAGQFIK